MIDFLNNLRFQSSLSSAFPDQEDDEDKEDDDSKGTNN